MTISGPLVCNSGDVVRALNNGRARVVNPDGNIQVATPGSPVTCVSGQALAAVEGASGLSTGAVVGGAAVLGAGVIGAIALSKKSSASP
jgi:apolipoprotein N-acyltransferase